MSILSDNMLYLRMSLKEITQQKMSDDLEIQMARYKTYESGRSEPPIEILQRIARYYHISVDLLISRDLRKVDLKGLLKLEDNRVLLPMKVNDKGDNFIEIIPHTAKAGYLSGYSDPEFIESLQHISLPFLKDGKHRAFPIEGDSMPPHKDGSFIVGRYVERLADIKNGKTYILLTRSEGIVYKRVQRKNKNTLLLGSDNTFYKPYEIHSTEIIEIWEFVLSLATKEYEPDDLSAENIKNMFLEIKKEIAEIRNSK